MFFKYIYIIIYIQICIDASLCIKIMYIISCAYRFSHVYVMGTHVYGINFLKLCLQIMHHND